MNLKEIAGRLQELEREIREVAMDRAKWEDTFLVDCPKCNRPAFRMKKSEFEILFDCKCGHSWLEDL